MEDEHRAHLFQPDPSRIKVYRPGGKKNGIVKYAVYNLATLFLLFRYRPAVVLYYESISAIPAIIYRWFFRSAKLMVHYHEYVTPREYQEGMKLVRFAHSLEKKNYHLFDWISQTNSDRLRLFAMDEKIDDGVKERMHLFPNYPPQDWQKAPANSLSNPGRLVYVGALSLETTYLKELVEWVNKQHGTVTLDLYSNNFPETTSRYLSDVGSDVIRFNGGIEYQELPTVLANYHVGVVLYKGHIPNYIYNVPNKVFEYLAVGLTVWYPAQMKSCKDQFETDNCRPQVLPVDFENLSMPEKMLEAASLPVRNSSFFFEKAKEEISAFIEKHS